MTRTTSMTDLRLFELIGEADPFTLDAAPSDADTDAALRILLESGPPFDARAASRPPSGRYSRRVVLRAGIGVSAAGAVAFGVVNVLPSSGPGQVATASADAVIRHALDALTPTTGSILHVDVIGSQTNSDGSTVTWGDQSWKQNSAPYDSRQIQTSPQGTTVQTATIDGTEQLYDPATDTVYEQSPPNYDLTPGAVPGTYELRVTPPRVTDASGTARQKANVQSLAEMFPTTTTTITITQAQAQALKKGTDAIRWRTVQGHGGQDSPASRPDSEREKLGQSHAGQDLVLKPVVAAVQSGGEAGGLDAESFSAFAVALMRSLGVRVDTQASVDGNPAIKISSDSGRQIYYVTPSSYQPIELDTTGEGGSNSLRFAAYQELTGAQARAVQLNLSAAHPAATVDQNQADFQAAQDRLFPGG
jgi:hypothetical protein